MKTYLLFAGDHYYPQGGTSDYIGEFDTVEEALEVARSKHPPEHYCWKPDNKWCSKYVYDWWEVVNRTTMITVTSGSN